MPTPEEIKKIARLFAYETSNGDALDPHIDFAEEFAVEVLQWLSEQFCIVPKSKVKEIDNIVCGTFSIGNIAVRQSWEYVKRKLFEEEK